MIFIDDDLLKEIIDSYIDKYEFRPFKVGFIQGFIISILILTITFLIMYNNLNLNNIGLIFHLSMVLGFLVGLIKLSKNFDNEIDLDNKAFIKYKKKYLYNLYKNNLISKTEYHSYINK